MTALAKKRRHGSSAPRVAVLRTKRRAESERVSDSQIRVVTQLEPKPTRQRKPRVARAPKPKFAPTLWDTVRAAFSRGRLLATAFATAFGGFVPYAGYDLVHHQIDWQLASAGDCVRALVVAGCLIFSFSTVYLWGMQLFRHRAKAAGFTVLLDGVMLTSADLALAQQALALLILINGVATGTNLWLRVKETPDV